MQEGGWGEEEEEEEGRGGGGRGGGGNGSLMRIKKILTLRHGCQESLLGSCA